MSIRPGILWTLLVVVLLAASALGLHRHGLPAQGKVLFLLIGLQFVTGISNAVLGWPLLAALLHTGAAAAMLVLLVQEARAAGLLLDGGVAKPARDASGLDAVREVYGHATGNSVAGFGVAAIAEAFGYFTENPYWNTVGFVAALLAVAAIVSCSCAPPEPCTTMKAFGPVR